MVAGNSDAGRHGPRLMPRADRDRRAPVRGQPLLFASAGPVTRTAARVRQGEDDDGVALDLVGQGEGEPLEDRNPAIRTVPPLWSSLGKSEDQLHRCIKLLFELPAK